jgi:hypothetical protein
MSDEGDPFLQAGERPPHELAIDYIKGAEFRVVWVDGLIGGITPTGNIHFAVYAERPAIPRRQVHTLNTETGQLGEPIPEKTIGRSALVREMACDLMLSPQTALALARWLEQQVEQFNKSSKVPR